MGTRGESGGCNLVLGGQLYACCDYSTAVTAVPPQAT